MNFSTKATNSAANSYAMVAIMDSRDNWFDGTDSNQLYNKSTVSVTFTINKSKWAGIEDKLYNGVYKPILERVLNEKD